MKRSFSAVGVAAAGSTREQILSAALRVLARDGFAALSARSIAAEAGTNLALMNYYFGSKEHLLLAMFDRLDTERVARQRALYQAPDEPLSAKWRRAVALYRQDLADGYVRVLQELTAQGYGNPVIAARVRERMTEWRAVLAEATAAALPALGLGHLSPNLVATAVTSFWWGMETQHLVGATEEDGHFFGLLATVGDWLEQRERDGAVRDGHAHGKEG